MKLVQLFSWRTSCTMANRPVAARFRDQPIFLGHHQYRTNLHGQLHRATSVGCQVNYLDGLTTKKKRNIRVVKSHRVTSVGGQVNYLDGLTTKKKRNIRVVKSHRWFCYEVYYRN